MNGLTPELVERIYAEASDALSNEEMYTRVQEHTGMTNEQLQEMKTFVDWPPESPDSWYHLS